MSGPRLIQQVAETLKNAATCKDLSLYTIYRPILLKNLAELDKLVGYTDTSLSLQLCERKPTRQNGCVTYNTCYKDTVVKFKKNSADDSRLWD